MIAPILFIITIIILTNKKCLCQLLSWTKILPNYSRELTIYHIITIFIVVVVVEAINKLSIFFSYEFSIFP